MRIGKIKTAANNFLNQYKTDNPATYAAAQQALGGLLILDGFVGIDNPFGGKKRSGIFGTLLAIIVGGILVFAPGLFNKFTGFKDMTATTTATVVSVTRTASGNNPNQTNQGQSCTAVAKYTVDGREYMQNSSYGSSNLCALSEGSSVQINYNPDKPEAWGYDLKSLETVMKILPFVGAIFIVAGVITFTIRLLSIIFGWKLLKNGRALAKSLPPGTDLNTIKSEIKQSFTKQLFNAGDTVPAVQQPTTPAATPPSAAPSDSSPTPNSQQ